ncbi:MAG: ribosome small subunit-dependent GTPase A [Gammaproteobacteria bacterium]
MSDNGRVVARYRRHCLIEVDSGSRIACQIGRRSLNPVVGDEVEWRPDSDDSGIVTSILPRKTELTRINNRGSPELVAANLTQLVVVLAIKPAADWFLLDRYLASAELANLKSIIVFNKLDLAPALPQELDDYLELSDAICTASAKQRKNLGELCEQMRGQRSAMIGQSGVGKSSLINALLGDSVQEVSALSEKSGHGRHTTTTSVLYRLPTGGELIDSPGVRDYAPYIEDPRDVQRGFREIARFSSRCRFDDCAHLAEPDCAVKEAVSDGAITSRRYESYKALLDLTESLQTGHR